MTDAQIANNARIADLTRAYVAVRRELTALRNLAFAPAEHGATGVLMMENGMDAVAWRSAVADLERRAAALWIDLERGVA